MLQSRTVAASAASSPGFRLAARTSHPFAGSLRATGPSWACGASDKDGRIGICHESLPSHNGPGAGSLPRLRQRAMNSVMAGSSRKAAKSGLLASDG